jgi:hypothetical protein
LYGKHTMIGWNNKPPQPFVRRSPFWRVRWKISSSEVCLCHLLIPHIITVTSCDIQHGSIASSHSKMIYTFAELGISIALLHPFVKELDSS